MRLIGWWVEAGALAMVGVMALSLSSQAQAGGSTDVNFDGYEVGKAPEDFEYEVTGAGSPGTWQVKELKAAPSGKRVLAQTAAPAGSAFQVAAYKAAAFPDVAASVKFRITSGKTEPAAGIVVRYKDKGNYYLGCANAGNGTVALYVVSKDQRASKPIASGKIAIKAGEWHMIGLQIQKDFLNLSFDDKPVGGKIEEETFGEKGGQDKVGVWTAGDTVAEFDDLTMKAVAPKKKAP